MCSRITQKVGDWRQVMAMRQRLVLDVSELGTLALEFVVGVAAVIGGLLMIIQSDGRLLGMNPRMLGTAPFGDYLLPGILLVVLIGGAMLLSAYLTWAKARTAHTISTLAGLLLILWVIIEYAYMGYWWLQAVVGVIGLLIISLALMDLAQEGV